MEKTKKTSVYLEPIHFKYLDLMSVLTGLNKSSIIRTLLDNEMLANEEIVKKYEGLLY